MGRYGDSKLMKSVKDQFLDVVNAMKPIVSDGTNIDTQFPGSIGGAVFYTCNNSFCSKCGSQYWDVNSVGPHSPEECDKAIVCQVMTF